MGACQLGLGMMWVRGATGLYGRGRGCKVEIPTHPQAVGLWTAGEVMRGGIPREHAPSGGAAGAWVDGWPWGERGGWGSGAEGVSSSWGGMGC